MGAPSVTESTYLPRTPGAGSDIVHLPAPEETIRHWVQGDIYPRVVIDVQNHAVLAGDGTAPPVALSGGGASTAASFVTLNAEAGLSNETTLAQVIRKDVLANRGAFGTGGVIFGATDNGIGYRDSGSAWEPYFAALDSGGHIAASVIVAIAESQVTGLVADLLTLTNAIAAKASATQALGGDMTGSSLPNPTIAASAVTLAKLANIGAATILGNNTGGGAAPIALTAAQVKTLLAIANTDVSGLGTASVLADPITIGHGGTGQTTKAAAFDALTPLTGLGDILYGGAAGTGTRLAGSTAVGRVFLSETSTGTPIAPAWRSIADADLPQTLASHLLALPTIQSWNGWITTDNGANMSPSTATVFTVFSPLDFTQFLPKGTKVWDGGTNYGVVASSSYLAPTTTVTLIGNNDYNWSTSGLLFWSYDDAPPGFPGSFNYTPAAITGWAAAPGSSVYQWSTHGTRMTIDIRQGADATSNATAHSISMPTGVAAITKTNLQWQAICLASDNGAASIGMVSVSSAGTTVICNGIALTSTSTNPGGSRIRGASVTFAF